MQVTFALAAMDMTLQRTSSAEKIVLKHDVEKRRTTKRFDALQKLWSEYQKTGRRRIPEIQELIARTEKAMAAGKRLMKLLETTAMPGLGPISLGRARFTRLFRKVKKALRAAQKMTHTTAFETWRLPPKTSDGKIIGDMTEVEYSRREEQNNKAEELAARRQRPVQCCMFLAVALSRLLEENDMLAEYEREIVGPLFERALVVDDAKTYEWSQMKDHNIARLLPPPSRYPKIWIRPGEEKRFAPRVVRNPGKVGTTVVTNQKFPGAGKNPNSFALAFSDV